MAVQHGRNTPPHSGGLLTLLLPYWPWIAGLVLLTIASNSLNLVGPQLIKHASDSIGGTDYPLSTLVVEFLMLAAGVFILTYGQAIVQTVTAERVARDLRARLVNTISRQDFAYVQTITPARLLTNLTSDVDAIKSFVSQAIASIVSSFFLIIGASVLLLLINWQLALAVLAVVPIIAVGFYVVLSRVRKLFRRSQEAVDWLNKVINESIIGAALIRLLDSNAFEFRKFVAANAEARDIGLNIIKLFSALIPVVTFAASL
ncbi:MAG TPA: ABC transporter transmembrane domain-containing protein, partial [Devosia sp.]|nr:ABC transporter transmembrane domain-containing protein [Devosia sp.]